MRAQADRLDLAKVDDDLLAERAADGDTRAFAALVRRHGPMVRGYAARILGGDSDADDVVQDTFITAWAQLRDLDDPARVRGWLLRIATRKAFDRLRSRRPVDPLEDGAEAPAPHDTSRIVEHKAATSALAAALAELPEQQRRCWLLKEAAGYTYDEISAELGIPNSTVRGLLSRARASILARMEVWR